MSEYMGGLLAQIVKTSDEPTAIAELLIEGCTDAKAMDIKALDVSAVSDIANIFLIASARSDRQSQGIASKAVAIAAQHGIRPISIEGYDRGHWILVDFGDVVLHVFYGPMREHYGIDNLWRHAPDVQFGRKTSTARSKPAPKRRRAVSAALVK